MGSWSVSVRFGSVRCLEHNALIFAFFLAWEKQIQIVSFHRFIAQAFCFFGRSKKSGSSVPKEVHREYRAAHFMSSGFQRAERAELGKSKLPEVSLQTIYC